MHGYGDIAESSWVIGGMRQNLVDTLTTSAACAIVLEPPFAPASPDIEVRQMPQLTTERVVLRKSHRSYLVELAHQGDDGSGRSDISKALASIISEHLTQAARRERTRAFAIAIPSLDAA